jgi:hypothetical protein
MHLARRTLLKGLGATIALPWLDAMAPAPNTQAAPALRLGFVYVSHGVIRDRWLTENLKPLEKMSVLFNVFTGLSHREADGQGSGDHLRASTAWLSGTQAREDASGIKLAATADQIAARAIGRDSPLRSLELSVDTPGDCISWRDENTPNVPENRPRAVFERLFGRAESSVLDAVRDQARGLAGWLGDGDRITLDGYLDAVRDVEKRLDPASFEEHAKVMFDLLILAWRGDLTRVSTMILARELSERTYPEIGIPGQHHRISHHREDAEMAEQKARIDTYHVRMLAYLLEKMQATRDGDGSLLDHSLILYGSGMSNGNLHRHDDLPVLAAGKLGGRFQTGYHYKCKPDTPMANLLVTILNRAGAPVEKLGDSTGTLELS